MVIGLYQEISKIRNSKNGKVVFIMFSNLHKISIIIKVKKIWDQIMQALLNETEFLDN